MKGGTLKIRDAFVVDYEEIPEVISRYNPVVDNETVQPVESLVTNGHFANQENIGELGINSGNHQILTFSNPAL